MLRVILTTYSKTYKGWDVISSLVHISAIYCARIQGRLERFRGDEQASVVVDGVIMVPAH